MIRLVIPLVAIFLASCANDHAPERPSERDNERLDSIEARLDAAEAADPVVPIEAAAPATLRS